MADIHYRKFAETRCIIDPPNALRVAALPRKILIAILVKFFTAKNAIRQYLCQFLLHFTIFESFIPDNYYYLQDFPC